MTHRKLLNRLRKPLRIVIVFALVSVIYLALSTINVFGFSGGYALEFDGDTDYVDLPLASEIIGNQWQITKTITLWVRPTGTAPVVGEVISGDLIFGDFPRWSGIYQANIGSEDRIWVLNIDNVPASIDEPVGIPYTVGEWVHIGLTHGNDTLTAYKNGIEIGSTTTYTTANGHPGALTGIIYRFGGGEGSGGGGFDTTFAGQIDEVRVYSRTLTASEIREDMYRTLSPGSDPTLGAYYRMSNGSGTTVTDDSGNGNDGTMKDGGIVIAPDGDTAEWIASGAFAGPRNALDFDGTDDYVTVPAAIAMPANLTLEAWIYPRDTSAGQKWIAGENGGAQLTSDGTTVQFRINEMGLAGPATATIAANEWQHIAGIYDGSDLRIFVNGVEGTSFSYSGSNQDAGGNFMIGSPDGMTQLNNVVVDEVRVWNTARTTPQIHENMFQPLQGTESGLVAYYRFDQAADATGSTTLYDLTTNGNDGTLTNMDEAADWVASSAFNTWIGSDSIAWTTAGNWSRNAVPSATDNVGVYDYTTVGNDPDIDSAVTLNNLVIESSGALNVGSSGSLAVSDRLFNYGTLAQTMAVSGSSDVGFFSIGGYGGVLVNPNGQDLGNTTVTIDGHQDCTTVPGETVSRCYDINPTNSPMGGTTLTFFFDSSELEGQSCDSLNAYHWNDDSGPWAWELLTLDTTYDSDGRLCGSDPQSVRVIGVDSFSPFALKVSAPTAISVESFSARSVSPIVLPALGLLILTSIILTGYLRKKTN